MQCIMPIDRDYTITCSIHGVYSNSHKNIRGVRVLMIFIYNIILYGIILLYFVVLNYYYYFLPSVVKIPRVKSKAKSKRNAGTARSRSQGLCGRKCPEWQLRCIVELPLTGVGIGRRSLACHQ